MYTPLRSWVRYFAGLLSSVLILAFSKDTATFSGVGSV